jgi:hypothetical protein
MGTRRCAAARIASPASPRPPPTAASPASWLARPHVPRNCVSPPRGLPRSDADWTLSFRITVAATPCLRPESWWPRTPAGPPLDQGCNRRHVTAGGRPAKPAPRQRFEGSCEGSWIESQSRRWRQEPHRQSTPGAARKGKSMYIGIGTVVLIVIIVLVILMLRRRLCCANAPMSASAA